MAKEPAKKKPSLSLKFRQKKLMQDPITLSLSFFLLYLRNCFNCGWLLVVEEHAQTRTSKLVAHLKLLVCPIANRCDEYLICAC